MELSKKDVDRAGEKLRQIPNDESALDVLAAWRDRHIYALKLAFNLLKRNTKKAGNGATYGQRLKRAPSIISKLERFPEMKLSRLQDIGGCRVILSDYNKLRVLYNKLEKSEVVLLKNDYITYPKDDGYRSIHLTYKCGSKDPVYAGLKIEYQLRTKLQHAWATAVEIIDTFEGENLKAGRGDKKWQRFFYLVAEEFAILEDTPLHNNTIKQVDRAIEIALLCQSLNVINKLTGYTIASRITSSYKKHSKDIKSANFVILSLIINKSEKSQIKIIPFKDQSEAQNYYIDQEKQFINDPSVNILMVKMDSIKQIKKSYPNYFADSEIFLETLTKILKIIT